MCTHAKYVHTYADMCMYIPVHATQTLIITCVPSVLWMLGMYTEHSQPAQCTDIQTTRNASVNT